jgi:hypothetical protein
LPWKAAQLTDNGRLLHPSVKFLSKKTVLVVLLVKNVFLVTGGSCFFFFGCPPTSLSSFVYSINCDNDANASSGWRLMSAPLAVLCLVSARKLAAVIIYFLKVTGTC